MSKRTNSNPLAKKTLTISRENYNRILMWSMSEKETQFLCLGSRNSVKKVVRMTNIATDPRNFTFWSENDYKTIIKANEKSGLKVVAYGHSHPLKHHDQHPSQTDIDYSETGEIWLIGFPHTNIVRGWVMSSTVKATINNEVNIKVLNMI